MRSILIIEDEPVICELCKRVLAKEDFRVDIANDGEVAKEKISENQYNLLILDMRLPKLSGEELYVWLLQEYPQLIKKISFTTGSVTRNETLKFMEKTGRLCLFKPFGKKELITFIEEALKNMENN